MGFLKVIRTWALRDKMPIREIARRTGIARNTIKKYLREGIVEPAFQTPDRPSKLDPYATQLTAWLVSDQRKSRKERRTAKLMHADLVKLGYDGSYERVAAFVREWKGERQRAYQTTDRGTFVPLVFASGEAFQFDWSEDWAYVGGERIKLQVAHIKLSHSRAFLVRAYLLQTHEMLFDAHWHAFRVFEGIPGRGIYDNMKTAVDKVGLGKKRDVNARFTAMTSHYVFDPEFCNPAAGWEKGQVEKNVRDARHRMWQLMPAFPDLSALNDWLEERCKLLWAETAHGTLPGSIADVWEAEKPALMPLPTMFDGFVEERKRVSPTCLITFDREFCLNLGDAYHQAARFSVSSVTSTPSLNLIPSMTFGNWFLPLRRSHFFDAASMRVKTISFAVFCDSAPLVRTVRCRTVANTLSIGFDVRRWPQCSAGKSKNASIASLSLVMQPTPFGYLMPYFSEKTVSAASASTRVPAC